MASAIWQGLHRHLQTTLSIKLWNSNFKTNPTVPLGAEAITGSSYASRRALAPPSVAKPPRDVGFLVIGISASAKAVGPLYGARAGPNTWPATPQVSARIAGSSDHARQSPPPAPPFSFFSSQVYPKKNYACRTQIVPTDAPRKSMQPTLHQSWKMSFKQNNSYNNFKLMIYIWFKTELLHFFW